MKSFLVRLSGIGLVVFLGFTLILSGCTKVKRWTGITSPDDEEVAKEAKQAQASPELAGETVVIDGKTYVKSRNPYYMTQPNEPEYVYYEKGKEFTGLAESIPAQQRVRLLRLVNDTSEDDATYALSRPLFLYSHADSEYVQPFLEYVRGSEAQELILGTGLYPAE